MGLVNDDYQWWIAAYVEATGEIIWSGGETFEPATFTVDIAVPALPTVSAYWGDLMPEMIVSLEPDTLWFQLYVGGNGEQYLAWHSINDPACDEFYNCRFEAENYLPLYWGPGEYAVWVQGWGPGGFSSPDGSDSVASWVSNSYGPGLVFPSEAPLSLENGDLSANSNDANIDLAWEPAENGTWQQVIVETDEGVVYYSQWHHVGDLGCSSGGSCGLVLENVPQGGYVIRIGSWGPGGFSTGGPNGDGYGVTEHSHSYISVA